MSIARYTVRVAGWTLRTYTPWEGTAASTSRSGRRIEEGSLRAWSLGYRRPDRTGGSVCIEFPAEWDELPVLQHAHRIYGGRGGAVFAEPWEDWEAATAKCFRHPEFPGCIDIVQRPGRQQELFA